jgi:uncharacterized protein (DUF2384 family)
MMIKAMKAVYNLFDGNVGLALCWLFSKRIRAFNYKRPITLILTGNAQEVVRVVNMIEYGDYT